MSEKKLTRREWNRGLTGTSAPGRRITRPGMCASEVCGTVADPGPLSAPAGTVRVQVPGSREPARWYCEGWCAVYGEALAELRPAIVADGDDSARPACAAGGAS